MRKNNPFTICDTRRDPALMALRADIRIGELTQENETLRQQLQAERDRADLAECALRIASHYWQKHVGCACCRCPCENVGTTSPAVCRQSFAAEVKRQAEKTLEAEDPLEDDEPDGEEQEQ